MHTSTGIHVSKDGVMSKDKKIASANQAAYAPHKHADGEAQHGARLHNINAPEGKSFKAKVK
jgi:hypothetical protein